MSKELEALKRVVNEISNYKLHGVGDENWLGIQDILKDIEVVEKALKRNEPMKPLIKHFGNAHSDIYCPSCKEFIGDINSVRLSQTKCYLFYCPDCGQEIDWSDEK